MTRPWVGLPAPGVERELHVVIPGQPHGMGRPRAVIRGKHAGVYERPEDASWKAYASALYQSAMFSQLHPCTPLAGPVAVWIVAVWACPKSAKKADRCRQRPRVGKPDADNIAKAVCDAGNGVLWVDDAQVVELHVTRFVAAEGGAPRVEVTVRTIAS